jgi:hypothetical protein
MTSRRLSNREIDRLIAGHYAGLSLGRPGARPALRRLRGFAAATGLAAAAAAAIWITVAGTGESQLAVQAARFCSTRDVPQAITRGLEAVHPIFSGQFHHGGVQ